MVEIVLIEEKSEEIGLKRSAEWGICVILRRIVQIRALSPSDKMFGSSIWVSNLIAKDKAEKTTAILSSFSFLQAYSRIHKTSTIYRVPAYW